eukprot:1239485-Pyramimonas_sp.AAC.1
MQAMLSRLWGLVGARSPSLSCSVACGYPDSSAATPPLSLALQYGHRMGMALLLPLNIPGRPSLHCSRHCLRNRCPHRTRTSTTPRSSTVQMAHVCPPSPVPHPGICSGSPVRRTSPASPGGSDELAMAAPRLSMRSRVAVTASSSVRHASRPV